MNDIVYVLRNTETNEVAMSTTNDFDAWAMYRDFQKYELMVFINGNKVAAIDGG